MYDRIARTWRLEEVVPPPVPFSPTRWTDADIGARSIFHQYPHSLRATGCLLHARPFKHVLTSAGCKDDEGKLVYRQKFESSHLTGCYDGETKVERKPQLHETQLAFAQKLLQVCEDHRAWEEDNAAATDNVGSTLSRL